MNIILTSIFASSVAFFAAGLAAILARRSSNGPWLRERVALPLSLCLAWTVLEGTSFFLLQKGGRRLDIAFVVDHYALFIVPLIAIIGALAGGYVRGERRFAFGLRAAVGAIAGAAIGLVARLAPSGKSFIDSAEIIFMMWDIASYAVLAIAALGCVAWIVELGKGGEFFRRCTVSVGCMFLLVMELVPRCRVGAASFFPWVSCALGAWGVREAIRSMRGYAAPHVVEPSFYPPLRPESSVPDLSAILSPREYEVAVAAAEGLRNAEIAERLFISLATVKKHLANAMEKADCRNRVELSAALRDRINLSATVDAPIAGRSSGHGGSYER